MKLNWRALWATSLTVALAKYGIPLFQQLIKRPENIFSVVLPYLLVVALVYFFWNRRLQ